MQMDEGMDTGPILLQSVISIELNETAGSLHDKLAILGASILQDALSKLEKGTLKPTCQPETDSHVAPMLTKRDGLIMFSEHANNVDCKIRGLDPGQEHLQRLNKKRCDYFSQALKKIKAAILEKCSPSIIEAY